MDQLLSRQFPSPIGVLFRDVLELVAQAGFEPAIFWL